MFLTYEPEFLLEMLVVLEVLEHDGKLAELQVRS